MGGNKIPMLGKRFGRLLVIDQAEKSAKSYNRQAIWICKCDCGGIVKQAGCNLRRGLVVSCGCRKKEYTHMITHNMCNTRFYTCWKDMHKRCAKGSRVRKFYYDKGVQVCPEWSSFQKFKEDMYASYDDSLTLDRIDNTNGYSKSNCRWATRQQQVDNRSTTKWLTFNGETHTLKQWAQKQGIPPTTVYNRIRVRGQTPETALRLL